jgi:hypothetical protein
MENSGSLSPPSPRPQKRTTKSHVSKACFNCKKAHLACDVSRPCRRCVNMGKEHICFDTAHKKRGRPKIRHQSDIPPSKSPTTTSTTSLFNAQNVIHMPSIHTSPMPPLSPLSTSNLSPEIKHGMDSSFTCVLDPELVITNASTGAYTHLSVYPDQLLHRHLSTLVHERDKAKVDQLRLKVQRGIRQNTQGTCLFEQPLHLQQSNGSYTLYTFRVELLCKFGGVLSDENTLVSCSVSKFQHKLFHQIRQLPSKSMPVYSTNLPQPNHRFSHHSSEGSWESDEHRSHDLLQLPRFTRQQGFL